MAMRKLALATSLTLLTAGLPSVAPAAAPDWSAIPVKTVKLFYPGQSSYQWLRSPEHRRAENRVKRGESCVSCHEEEETSLGDLLVKGGRLESTPIDGKNGGVDLNVQAAYDTTNLYLRFQWKTQFNRPGQMHNYMLYDGEKWVFYGGPRSSGKVRSGKEPPLYEDRLAIMIDDGSVPTFAEQGCWLTCHNGMRDMPNEATAEQLKVHPLLGEVMKQSDVRKYLPATRSDAMASWEKTQPVATIAKLKAEGQFVDLMQWRAHRSNPVGMADDGYVLEYRLFDEGKNMFSWNVDRKTMTPKYMFDKAKVGVQAISVADIGDPAKPFAVIKESNAVPYDPAAGWKKGDVLPGRLLSRPGSVGSASDNSDVHGTWKDGTWTVEFARPLDTGHPGDDKRLQAGKAYTIGLAVHDDNVTTRFHFVSFPLTLGIGAEAAIQAVKLP